MMKHIIIALTALTLLAAPSAFAKGGGSGMKSGGGMYKSGSTNQFKKKDAHQYQYQYKNKGQSQKNQYQEKNKNQDGTTYGKGQEEKKAQ